MLESRRWIGTAGWLSIAVVGLGCASEAGDATSSMSPAGSGNSRAGTGGAAQPAGGGVGPGGSNSSGSAGRSSSGGSGPASGGSAGAGGDTAPGGVACGAVTCDVNEECCNASCGICVPPGGGCIELFCDSDAGASGSGSCTTDSDCRLFDDYCTGCDCRALATTDPDPTCPGPGVQCIVAPCLNKRASCDNGSCVAVDE